MSIFTTLFYQPVLNLFVFFYNIIPGHDISMAVILFGLAIKLILLPIAHKALVSQKKLQDLQPKLEAIKAEFKDNKEGLTKAMMDLYKNNKVNPFSSCLLMLIQLPFFIAVFRMFQAEFSGKASDLVYGFLANPYPLNNLAFGLLDFSKPNIYLAILAGLSQFAQVKLMPQQAPAVKSDGSKDENMATMMNKQMMYIFPVMTIFICLSLPSGLAFYWVVTTVLAIIHQVYLFRKKELKEVEVVK
jgi:YidC/Oxa1 family membrane protein insertase